MLKKWENYVVLMLDFNILFISLFLLELEVRGHVLDIKN